LNVKVCFMIDCHSCLLKARPRCSNSQRITRMRFHSDNVRTLWNLSPSEVDDDTIHARHCWHVDTVIRHISIIVEDQFTLLK